MAYNNLILNSEENSNINFSTLATSSKVKIFYADSGIQDYCGPVPMVDISTSVDKGSNDLPETMTTTIRMQGKILRHSKEIDNAGLLPPTPGFSGIIGAIDNMKALFAKYPFSNFSIKCDNLPIFYLGGVSVRDVNFNQTGDNWTKTADFDITLEHIAMVSGYESDPPTTNKVDRWSVEQLDDNFYTIIPQHKVKKRPEWSNPVLGADQVNIGGGLTFQEDISIVNIPQYRVTHTVSAKGLCVNSGLTSTLPSTPSANNIAEFNRIALGNAQKWVHNQLKNSCAKLDRESGPVSGVLPYYVIDFASNPNPKTFLFNHIRSVNIDLTTYEVTDTWLAMPTGIGYTETYSLESSVGEDNTKTVRVVGNVVGLHFSHPGASGLHLEPAKPIDLLGSLVDGSGYDPASPNANLFPTTRIKDLDSSEIVRGSDPYVSYINKHKYYNALSGWLFDIKPNMYRRACIAMNTPDRTLDYTSPAFLNKPPENHIYCKERPLSPIPASINEGHDPRKGTITYSVEYRNSFKIISGVISENIDISYDVPRDEVATIPVPGRVLGPILSRTGRSASRKTVNISVVVIPPSTVNGTLLDHKDCPVYTGGNVYNAIRDIILGNKPFIGSNLINRRNNNGIVFTQSDTESWNPSQGRYSRNVQWIYQACENNKDYMEH